MAMPGRPHPRRACMCDHARWSKREAPDSSHSMCSHPAFRAESPFSVLDLWSSQLGCLFIRCRQLLRGLRWPQHSFQKIEASPTRAPLLHLRPQLTAALEVKIIVFPLERPLPLELSFDIHLAEVRALDRNVDRTTRAKIAARSPSPGYPDIYIYMWEPRSHSTFRITWDCHNRMSSSALQWLGYFNSRPRTLNTCLGPTV